MAGWFRVDPADLVERTVRVTTLARVCEQHVAGTIDFLKIDVDGHEREVLAGGDWARWRPRVVLVEAYRPETWEPRLLAADYLFAVFDGVNRVYVRAEDRSLLPALAHPVNSSDRFEIHRYLLIIEDLRQRLAAAEETGAVAGGDLHALRRRLAAAGEAGPVALGVARRLHHLARTFPRVAAGVKRIARLAG